MTTKPNIIFIVADDMGYGDFSAFNYGVSHTPALDELIRDGVCLTQHYSASAVCAPARAGLLTGRYPQRTGVIDTLSQDGMDSLDPRERTIGDYFRRWLSHRPDRQVALRTGLCRNTPEQPRVR
jgi:arylsulfatase A